MKRFSPVHRSTLTDLTSRLAAKAARVKILYTCCHIVSELDSFIEGSPPGLGTKAEVGETKKKLGSNCTREEFIKIYCGTPTLLFVQRSMCEGVAVYRVLETVSFCKLCAPLNFAVYDTSTCSWESKVNLGCLSRGRAKGVANK